jgi:hypothetical protein
MNYFFNFSNTNSSNPPYTNTLPASDCSNGSPIDKYAGYGTSSTEVLYSIWCSCQNNEGATFTTSQDASGAPTTHPTTGPANIFIIRHAEKNASPALNYCLDNNGIYRACQLISYVNQLAADGTPISYLVTCNPCAYNTADSSMRPEQTIAMVSFMLNIPMFIFGGSQDYTNFTNGVFSAVGSGSPYAGIFDGLNILVCWEHSAIQGLCLNILNKAGTLPTSRLDVTSGDPDLYGDAFFGAIGTNGNPLCPNGSYKCDNPSLTNYNATYDPTLTVPSYIGDDSQYYPYWNTYNFQSVYWLRSTPSDNYTFKTTVTGGVADGFRIFDQPNYCETCYASCDLHIGLYQPLTTQCTKSNKYYNSSDPVEQSCLPPSDWSV